MFIKPDGYQEDENSEKLVIIDDRYVCTRCGRTYKNIRHIRRHWKECGQIPKLQCPYCPHRCHRKFGLDSHIRNNHKNVIF